MSDDITAGHPGYTTTARLLHWLIAGMIVLQFVLAELAEMADAQNEALSQLALLANHKSVGITVLVLALIRLGWRLAHPIPQLPRDMPGWQVIAASFAHWSLYLLLFALPISGWLMSSASAYSVSWFNLITLPDFVAPSERLEGLFHEVHEILATALFVIALAHIAAALKHALVDRDGVLKRMSSRTSVSLFVIVIAAGIVLLRPGSTSVSGTSTPVSPNAVGTSPSAEALPASKLPEWLIDYEQSHLRFSAEQAGAAFTGEWRRWEADVQFHPDALPLSRAEVTVHTGEVFSNDSERDSTITGSDFFAAAQYPHAVFRASAFTRDETGDGFVADGSLNVKGLAVPVRFHFNVAQADQPDHWVLTGRTTLDRLQLNVGTGDWSDTSWVGQFVEVQVKVVFRAPLNQ